MGPPTVFELGGTGTRALFPPWIFSLRVRSTPLESSSQDPVPSTAHTSVQRRSRVRCRETGRTLLTLVVRCLRQCSKESSRRHAELERPGHSAPAEAIEHLPGIRPEPTSALHAKRRASRKASREKTARKVFMLHHLPIPDLTLL